MTIFYNDYKTKTGQIFVTKKITYGDFPETSNRDMKHAY